MNHSTNPTQDLVDYLAAAARAEKRLSMSGVELTAALGMNAADLLATSPAELAAMERYTRRMRALRRRLDA